MQNEALWSINFIIVKFQQDKENVPWNAKTSGRAAILAVQKSHVYQKEL